MWAAIKRFFSSPVFDGDEDKTRSAQLLNTLLRVVLMGVIVFTGSVFFFLRNEMEPLVLIIALVLGIVTILMYVLLRRGYVLQVANILAFTLWLGFTIPMFSFAGIHDSAITGYFFIISMVGVVAGWRSILFFTGLTSVALISAYYMEQVGLLVATIPLPSKIDDLILVLLMLGSTALILWYAVQRISGAYERLRQNARALELSNQDLEISRHIVEEQAMELKRQALYLETIAKIAREAAALLDTPGIMMRRVVEIIASTFDYYLVSIFLVDETRDWAELKAASNEYGRKLIERNYRLRVGTGWAGEGIIGNVVATGNMRVVRDVKDDEHYVDTTELPDTVSEITFPLLVRGLVVGVLDIQSSRSEKFSDVEIQQLMGLVNQVALAIDNARLVDRLRASASTQSVGSIGGLSREVWNRILSTEDKSVISDAHGTHKQAVGWQSEMVKAARTGEVATNDTRTSVALPIKSRDQIIGVINAQLPATKGEWTIEQLTLLQSISEQLGTALEAAQLYNDTQRRVVRETLTREVTEKIRNTINWEELLQTALQEMSEVMGVSRAFIQWSPPEAQPEDYPDMDL